MVRARQASALAASARFRQAMLRTLAFLLVLLFVLAVLVRLAEPRLVFFPMGGEFATPADRGLPFEAITLTTSDGERVHAWWMPHERPAALVVYFHGNGGNLSVWLDVLARVHRRGFSVFAMDYRGYGLSTGSPTEPALYRDVEAVLEHLPRLPRSDGTPVVYWGRSLGTAMAAYAGTRTRPDGIVLEAGFPSARAVTRSSPILFVLSMLATVRFPTADYMREAHVPALVIHGTADSVIPYHLGVELHATLPEGTPFLSVEGGDHNDLEPPRPAEYWAAIDAFVRGLRR
jgi:hypothetical protein